MPKKNKNKIGYSFVPWPIHIATSPEYARLSAHEVKLLIDLYSQSRKANNGDFCASWSYMKARGWKSRETLNKCLSGLLEKGFIVKTRQGGKNKCSLYGVTWQPIDECQNKLDKSPTKVASNEWKLI